MLNLKTFLIIFAFFPSLALASAPTNFAGLLYIVADLIYTVIPVLMSLAVVGFLWGVALYIWKGSSSTEREKGRSFMFWGIIGLFVMISFWGLVGILGDTFFPGNSSGQLNPVNMMETPQSQQGGSFQI